MNPNGIALKEALDNLWVSVFDAPDENASLTVVTDHAVLCIESSQFTNDSNCVFILIALHFRVGDVQISIFLYPHCGDNRVAGLNEIVQAEDAIGDGCLSSFKQHDYVIHLVKPHPVHKLAL